MTAATVDAAFQFRSLADRQAPFPCRDRERQPVTDCPRRVAQRAIQLQVAQDEEEIRRILVDARLSPGEVESLVQSPRLSQAIKVAMDQFMPPGGIGRRCRQGGVEPGAGSGDPNRGKGLCV